jgi:hypothetical protein
VPSIILSYYYAHLLCKQALIYYSLKDISSLSSVIQSSGYDTMFYLYSDIIVVSFHQPVFEMLEMHLL